MTLFVDDSDFQLHVGDALEVLRGLPDESVHCVVTSPPYWGLRDYGTGSWDGGNEDCDHKRLSYSRERETPGGRGGSMPMSERPYGEVCKCGARRIDSQLGLEPTPDAYVANMVNVFREVRRVLRRDGTCWLNIGDSYASGGGAGNQGENGQMASRSVSSARITRPRGGLQGGTATVDVSLGGGRGVGLKPKDLVGIPWRLAFALQADGWYLRSDIIWSKPNPMPESVTDRPTKAHEFVFLLTKGEWKGPAKGRFCDLSESDKRWLALLVDAEGNICVKRVAPKEGKPPQYGAQVAIGSTSRALLERVQQITGCGNVNERPGTNATMFYWQASNKVARDLLYSMYPHLIVKPRQARIAIHLESLLYHRGHATMRTDSENAALESLWTRNKACNQFGDPDLSDVPEPRYGRWGPTRYFYDADAIRESAEWARWGDQTNGKHEGSGSAAGWIGSRTKEELQRRGPTWEERKAAGAQRANRDPENVDASAVHMPGQTHTLGDGRGRNKRSVWEIATQPYPQAHFATFPEALVEPCVLAGTSERGCCPVCGAPWEREIETTPERVGKSRGGNYGDVPRTDGTKVMQGGYEAGMRYRTIDHGWRPNCKCKVGAGSGTGYHALTIGKPPEPVPCTVLDPFMGSGTTALVARGRGRKTIGIELSREYAQLAAERLQQLSLFADA